MPPPTKTSSAAPPAPAGARTGARPASGAASRPSPGARTGRPAAPVGNRPAAKGPALLPDGKVDKKELVEQYRPFVRSIAGKIKKTLAKEIEFDDLMEFGTIGLLEAADRFDPKHGANFMTFSYYRVRGAIYDGLRQMGWVSRNEYAKLRFEERANAYLANVSNRQTIGDKTSEAEINELAAQVQNLVTIYVTSLEGMEGLQVEDKDAVPIDSRLADLEMKAYVRQALSQMDEQEQTLLTMYYFKEMSLQEVGDHLKLSKSWTSRLHAKAIEKLGRNLQELTREAVAQGKVRAR